VDAGRYESKLWHNKDYPKIHLLTIEGLRNKAERVDAPRQMNPFAKAQREAKPGNLLTIITDGELFPDRLVASFGKRIETLCALKNSAPARITAGRQTSGSKSQ
jgi:hypothetical protein